MKMTSSRRTLSTLGLASALCVASLAGCAVDNQLSFTISQFAALTQESMCVADPGVMTSLNSGILDVGISTESYGGYYVAPIVVNNLNPTGTAAVVETNTIQLTGVQVELRPTKGTTLDAAIPAKQRKFFVPAAGGLIEPMGKAGMVVEVIPTALALSLAQTIQVGAIPERLIVRIHPTGKHAGQDIDGGGVDFPVNICKFCLSTPPAACPDGGADPATINLGSCYPEQDAKVTCCKATTGNTVCGKDVPLKQN